jgi:hypothetical protein
MPEARDNVRITRGAAKLVRPTRRRTTTQAKIDKRRHVDTTVSVTKVPDVGMDAARELAEGDMSRVEIQRDGTVLIKNQGKA